MGAIGNFVAFYVFGLPLGIFLVFFMHMGALGMWIGLATASFLQVSVFFYITKGIYVICLEELLGALEA